MGSRRLGVALTTFSILSIITVTLLTLWSVRGVDIMDIPLPLTVMIPLFVIPLWIGLSLWYKDVSLTEEEEEHVQGSAVKSSIGTILGIIVALALTIFLAKDAGLGGLVYLFMFLLSIPVFVIAGILHAGVKSAKVNKDLALVGMGKVVFFFSVVLLLLFIIGFFEQLEKQQARNTQIEQIEELQSAVKSGNPDNCDSLKGKNVFMCYSQLAIQLSDYTVCDGLPKLHRGGCYDGVAQALLLPEACEQIVELTEYGRDGHDLCLLSITRETKDGSLCERMLTKNFYSECLRSSEES